MNNERYRKTFYPKVCCGLLGLLTLAAFIGPFLSMGKMSEGIIEDYHDLVSLTTPSIKGS